MNATTSDAGNYICTLISDNGEFIDAAFSSLTVSSKTHTEQLYDIMLCVTVNIASVYIYICW